jgi:hypothetical protein
MAAGETPALLSAANNAHRKECGRLDRGHSGVRARVLSGRRPKFVGVLACVKYGFVVAARKLLVGGRRDGESALSQTRQL